MFNLTFNNKKVIKIYDSEVNTAEKKLTIRFSPSKYTLEYIKAFFNDNREYLNEIIKTQDDGSYITTYMNYTTVLTNAASINYNIVIDETKSITTLNENDEEITTTVPSTETTTIELITVILGYKDPTLAMVDKLNKQINPSIDINTCSLVELQKHRQKENKDNMNDFFRNNPLLFTDGVYYGVEDEDRREMAEEFMGYILERDNTNTPNKSLEWHSKGKACTERTLEEFSAIAIAIRNYTKPYFRKMQEIKEKIFEATSKEEVLSIKIFGE